MSNRPTAVCIIDENLSVPRDPRVWREAVALARAGYLVSVICPKGKGFESSFEKIDGVSIHRYTAYEASGHLDYLVEYAWALFCEFILALKIYASTRFSVIQACNPPDTIFLIARFFKLFGVRFIFDQHDPAPELYEAKFQRRGFLYRLAKVAERLTFRTADAVVVTNESCREIAVTRGKVSPDRVFVVRNCPDLDEFRLPDPQPDLKRGRTHMVVYVGIMGSQDGVDMLLESIEYLVMQKARKDTLFVLIGPGPEQPRLKGLATARGLDEWVTFTGGLYGADLLSYLATADVAVAPDPCNDFNDKLSMIKILEYQACGVPVVLYDLIEGRRCAGDAALFADRNDPIDFGNKVATLLDSEPLRHQLGSNGRRRIEGGLNWAAEKGRLLKAYEFALGVSVVPEPELQKTID
jgi:glycosyltransferase involved in cell wall biosynthesis